MKSAQKGDTSLIVSPGLSWNATDKIGLPSTTINWNEVDYAVIKSYDNVTGVVNLDRPLSHYHFGKSESTGPQYSGVDMRGEVVLLSRNIKIIGNDTEAWGC
jgi:hypothetical protein